ncbi:hypothetical protein CRUP_020895, partial [Coryphaenoides rupestris]
MERGRLDFLSCDYLLTVYNYRGGPCYRCLYPVPPPADTVTNCSDGGVLGVAPMPLDLHEANHHHRLQAAPGSEALGRGGLRGQTSSTKLGSKNAIETMESTNRAGGEAPPPQTTLSPLENAIETMESTNDKILTLINQYQTDLSLPINPLSMLLNGIVDPAVMGGFAKYEKLMSSLPNFCGIFHHLERLLDEGRREHITACYANWLSAVNGGPCGPLASTAPRAPPMHTRYPSSGQLTAARPKFLSGARPEMDERKSSRPRSMLRSMRQSIISISSLQGA